MGIGKGRWYLHINALWACQYLIVSTSHRVCTIKNIDFTDFSMFSYLVLPFEMVFIIRESMRTPKENKQKLRDHTPKSTAGTIPKAALKAAWIKAKDQHVLCFKMEMLLRVKHQLVIWLSIKIQITNIIFVYADMYEETGVSHKIGKIIIYCWWWR